MPNPENLIGKGFESRPEDINRSGRPLGSRNRSTIVRELFEALCPAEGKPYVEVATAKIVKKAADGDTQAWEKLLDSAYGKVAEKSELSGPNGGPIETQQSLSEKDKLVLEHYFKTKGKDDV